MASIWNAQMETWRRSVCVPGRPKTLPKQDSLKTELQPESLLKYNLGLIVQPPVVPLKYVLAATSWFLC